MHAKHYSNIEELGDPSDAMTTLKAFIQEGKMADSYQLSIDNFVHHQKIKEKYQQQLADEMSESEQDDDFADWVISEDEGMENAHEYPETLNNELSDDMFFTTKQYLKAEKYIEVIKNNRKKHHITRDNDYGHEIHLKSLQRLTDIVSKMNNDQSDAFNAICAHLTGDDIAKTAENPKGQLRMMLSGEGGTGKSFLIEAISLFTKLYFPTPKGSEHETCIIGAPTGKAALNVNGHTIENLFNFPFLSLRGDKISDPAVQKYYQDRFSHVQLLILDEVSMMGLKKLHKIHQILCCAKQTSDNASCRTTDFQSLTMHLH